MTFHRVNEKDATMKSKFLPNYKLLSFSLLIGAISLNTEARLGDHRGPARPQSKEAFHSVKINSTESAKAACISGRSPEAQIAGKRALAKLGNCDTGISGDPELLPFNPIEEIRGWSCMAHAIRKCH